MATELTLASERRNGVALVDARGELDVYTATQLRGLLDELVDAGARDIVVDVEGVSFIDSHGLGVLIETRASLTDLGGRLRLENPGRAVYRVLAIADLLDDFDVASR